MNDQSRIRQTMHDIRHHPMLLLVPFVLFGYVGFQFAGWTGAILLPVGIFTVMSILFAPILTLAVVVGVVIQIIRGVRAVKTWMRGE